MTAEQKNNYNMFLTTQHLLDNKTDTWSYIPRVVTYKNNLDELIARIEDKLETTGADKKVTERKDQLKKLLAIKLSAVSGALQAHGHETNDLDLVNKVSASKSDVERLRDSDVATFANNLLGDARNYPEQMPEFGITQAYIYEVQTSVDEFKSLVGEPRNILSQQYASLGTIDALIKECRDMLKNKLDNAMLFFSHTQPEFYEGYLRARTVVDR